jgi:hypothetical protein
MITESRGNYFSESAQLRPFAGAAADAAHGGVGRAASLGLLRRLDGCCAEVGGRP